MSVLALARDVLESGGVRCAMDERACLAFTIDGARGGRGSIAETTNGALSLQYRPALADDPVALASEPAFWGAMRLLIESRCAVIQGTMSVEALSTAVALLSRRSAPASAEQPPGLPIVDVEAGELGVALPPLRERSFVRVRGLLGGGDATVDRARATYLLVANASLRATTGGWLDGPGVAADVAAGMQPIRAELREVAQCLRVLARHSIAAGYLELCGITTEGRMT